MRVGQLERVLRLHDRVGVEHAEDLVGRQRAASRLARGCGPLFLAFCAAAVCAVAASTAPTRIPTIRIRLMIGDRAPTRPFVSFPPRATARAPRAPARSAPSPRSADPGCAVMPAAATRPRTDRQRPCGRPPTPVGLGIVSRNREGPAPRALASASRRDRRLERRAPQRRDHQQHGKRSARRPRGRRCAQPIQAGPVAIGASRAPPPRRARRR